MKCDRCTRTTKGFVTAQKADRWGDWSHIQGIFCLDCARANMHKRAAHGIIVAVFPNIWNKLADNKFRYSIDNRDKSNWLISSSLGGIINSRQSDWF